MLTGFLWESTNINLLRVDTGDDGRISKEEFTNPKVKDAIEKVTNLNYFGK